MTISQLGYYDDHNALGAVQFDWRALDPTCLDAPVTRRRIKGKKQVSNISVEITLQKQEEDSLASDNGTTRHPFNIHSLHDVAFASKSFTISLSKALFKKRGENGNHLYSYCIIFDRSPYPPPDEWKESELGPRHWAKREFVGVKPQPGRASQWMSIKYHLRYVFRDDYEELRISHVREQKGGEFGLASFFVLPLA